MGIFDFFFSKYPQFSNLKLDFFPVKKSFSQIANFFHLIFIFKKKTEKLFFPKIPPILELEVGFLSNIKSFSQIFENTPNFSCLNYVWRIFQQDQRNFFGSNKLIFIKIPLEKATDTGHFGREQVNFYLNSFEKGYGHGTVRSLLTLLESSGKPTATINSARVYVT